MESKRHGSKNQHRHKHFLRWLLQKFPLKSPDHAHNHVLDIAGGKGELSARLTMCERLKVVMIDPRKANVMKCYVDRVLPTLPKKWQERFKSRSEEFVKNTLEERFRQHTCHFDEDLVERSPEIRSCVENSSLLVGLHADGATEAIVDVALKYEKAFVVVPCCVFPNFFSKREVLENGKMVKVRSHDQFCNYLLAKDPRFSMDEIPIPGRNIAIWWNGKH